MCHGGGQNLPSLLKPHIGVTIISNVDRGREILPAPWQIGLIFWVLFIFRGFKLAQNIFANRILVGYIYIQGFRPVSLHFGTIPGQVGSVRVRLAEVG